SRGSLDPGKRCRSSLHSDAPRRLVECACECSRTPQGSPRIYPKTALPSGSAERPRTGFAAMKGEVSIWTDGACSGNPGPGGWGAILSCGGHEKELFGGEVSTTNNRMELTAAIAALEALKRPCAVHLHTDSNYLKDGITSWIIAWKRNGWRTA